MENEPQTPAPPRRKRRFARYALLVLFATCAFFGWREYTFRKAIREIKAAGFEWQYDDPIEIIRNDWRAIFRKETWASGERTIVIRETPWAVVAEHREAIERLYPRSIIIYTCTGSSRLDLFKNLHKLRELGVSECEDLTTVAGIEIPTSVEILLLLRNPALKNVDALKSLTGLKEIYLNGCSSVTAEAVDALRAALPNTKIFSDY